MGPGKHIGTDQEWIFRDGVRKWYVRKLEIKDHATVYYHAFPMYQGIWRTMHPVWIPVFTFGCN